MKRVFGFGTFTNRTICSALLVLSFVLLYRFIYLGSYGIDQNGSQLVMDIYIFYRAYLEPIVMLVWVKFVCELFYKLLEKE
jgi:hypothetical protein